MALVEPKFVEGANRRGLEGTAFALSLLCEFMGEPDTCLRLDAELRPFFIERPPLAESDPNL